MMRVQTYLKEHGIEKLQEEFSIIVTDYPDRVILNYNQIDSPRFNPICDECRALILRKPDYSVLARSFDRFYNVGEGEAWKIFPISEARVDEKLDGSLISVYWDGEDWCVSTRKRAYAEGTTVWGQTFRELFDSAKDAEKLWDFLKNTFTLPNCTWIFELTSPENRIVTRYEETNISLIGVRDNESGDEWDGKQLDSIAQEMGVKRPRPYKFYTMDETIAAAKSLEIMEEGFVLVVETPQGSHARLKCKNEKFVAIAHMRENGQISPRRVLTLVMANEHLEYLGYFPEDKHYFDFVEKVYREATDRIALLRDEHLGIEDQKEFALTIIPKTVYSFEKGVLFRCKKGENMRDILNNLGAKRLAKSLDLRKQFIKNFKIILAEED